MSKKKLRTRIISAVTAAFVLGGTIMSLPVPAYAAETVSIGSIEDFERLALLCTSEQASVGLTVYLQTDLDFSDTDFTPIPTFSGTFEGGGHSIKGIRIIGSGSSLGMFRYIEASGSVRNLSVSGTIEPDGSREKVGGIAGVNRGTIEACSFSGQVTAKEMAGGIAGSNEENGTIDGCSNNANVKGNTSVGGIAGNNEGTVSDCKNWGQINVVPDGAGEEDNDLSSMSLDLDLEFDKTHGLNSDKLNEKKISDIGGIAGYSTGLLSASVNYGAVGYEHMGYNVGGVVGRQDGLVVACRNGGTVTGRKDVGGIVGQLEPLLTVSYTADTLDKLETKLDEMTAVRDSLKDTIRSSVDNTSDHAGNTLDRMEEIWDSVQDMKDSREGKRDAFETDLDGYLNRMDRIYEDMDLDLINKDAKRALNRIQNNSKQARDIIGQLSGNGSDTASPSDAGRIIDELIASGGDINALESQIMGEISSLKTDLLEDYKLVLELRTCVENIAKSIPVVIDEGIEGADDGISDFKDDLDALQSESDRLYHTVRDYTDELEDDIDELDDDVSAKVDAIISETNTMRDDLDAEKADIRSNSDQLYTQLDELRDILSDGREELRDDVDDLTDEDSSLFEDVSASMSGSDNRSTISECRNTGIVTADFQAGGIVGTIGTELAIDGEKDVETIGEKTLQMDRTIRALVFSCKNTGDISVTNDYAGGIAGRASAGALVGNLSLADVTTEDGCYIGGIAGSSQNSIRASVVRGTITGKDSVGGIAGYATDLKDNYSMAVVTGEGELHGSIAGDADEDGTITGNFFVEGGPGAVDGITYAAQAAAITADDMLSRAEVPDDFRTVSVSFLDGEDQLIKKITLDYGSAVSEELYPDPPVKSGYYDTWEEVDLSNVRQDIKVHAVYDPWKTVISSDDSLTPLLLVQADFHPTASLSVTEMTAKEADIATAGIDVKTVYRYAIEDTESDLDETVTLHARIPDGVKNASVMVLHEDGTMASPECTADGQYLIFDAPTSGTILIISEGLPVPVWAIGAGAAVIAAAAYLVIRSLGRKKQD